jgi:hypothetical protein
MIQVCLLRNAVSCVATDARTAVRLSMNSHAQIAAATTGTR